MDDKLLVLDRHEELTRTGHGFDDSHRNRAGKFGGRGYEGVVCDAAEDLPPENLRSQVRINVNVHSLTVERKPGFFDFVFSQPAQRMTLNRFAVEISEQGPARNIMTVRQIIATLRDILRLHDFGVDTEFIGRRNPEACDHQEDWLAESDATESTSLNIWV